MTQRLEPYSPTPFNRLMQAGTMTSSSDAELLDRFACHRDEAAFEALLNRHGPMVLWTCRRILHDTHNAEDAFQATFLVLARKAGSLWVKDTLATWLYRIAVRIAVAARTSTKLRQTHERQAALLRTAESNAHAPPDPDLLAYLCEEIDRLPARYRQPIILCHLQEMTHESAARMLQCPIGTVHGRLSRARSMLRKRLARRGLSTLTAVTACRLLEGRSLAASIPLVLGHATTRAASGLAASRVIPTGLISASVAEMTTRTLRTWSLNAVWKFGLPALLTVLTLGTGLVAVVGSNEGKGNPVRQEQRSAPAQADPGPDEKAIQGKWIVTRIDQVNHQASEDEKAYWKSGKMTMTIDATRIIFDTDGSSAPYTLDPSANPQRMRLLVNGKQRATAIYKLEGDDLKIFIGRGQPGVESIPPADFSIKSAPYGTFPTLFVLKRKPAQPEFPDAAAPPSSKRFDSLLRGGFPDIRRDAPALAESGRDAAAAPE